ncbi:hypothetical protein SAMN05421740_11271 [Parapedobacter koreensis]|uniref:Uncharacterized protein n=1 Tax=Parapedobacter koreensis TaxID=332977 RepID=A0A1H7TTZ4_9SPHI|nr:hypothetical protein SAMN05421740_11271 [Parapedobacter koreensis]
MGEANGFSGLLKPLPKRTAVAMCMGLSNAPEAVLTIFQQRIIGIF